MLLLSSLRLMNSSTIYLISRLLSSPKEIFFTLLIFILSKSLSASALQLTLIASIKPISSLFSFYVSSLLHPRPHQMRLYLLLNIVTGAIPCLFFPFIDTVWFYICSYAIHMVTMRAQDPAWIELLKSDHPLPIMGKIISRGSSIYYFVSMSLPPLLSFWLDSDPHIWKALYFSFALLQLINLLPLLTIQTPSTSPPTHAIHQPLIAPLITSWHLLTQKPAFAHYLLLFFLGGAGIVATQPLLPTYFDHTLHLSYKELTLAFSFCKGLSFLLSSPLWARHVPQLGLFRLNALMDLFTCLFFAALLLSQFEPQWLYLAYLFYGSMQGGSELTWNLSGPTFSQTANSIPYSASISSSAASAAASAPS